MPTEHEHFLKEISAFWLHTIDTFWKWWQKAFWTRNSLLLRTCAHSHWWERTSKKPREPDFIDEGQKGGGSRKRVGQKVHQEENKSSHLIAIRTRRPPLSNITYHTLQGKDIHIQLTKVRAMIASYTFHWQCTSIQVNDQQCILLFPSFSTSSITYIISSIYAIYPSCWLRSNLHWLGVK